MPRQKKTVIEFRDYDLPVHFPVLLLTGEHWRISDVPSGRLHIHNCLEIGICETDNGIMKFEDTSFPFQAGDITAVSCDIPHTTCSAPGTNSKWSYLFVDMGELLHPFFYGTDLHNVELFSVSEHHLNLIMGKEKYPVIHSLVYEIMEEMIHKEGGYELAVRGLFLTLASNLMRIAARNQKKKDQPPENALVIAPALEFIRYHYMEDFPMEHLADLCGLSPTHFRRLFSSITGKRPLDHLNTTRIRKAADLLRMTEDSVLSISERVGFHSISSFNRYFLAIIGRSPRDWRKQMSIIKDQSLFRYNGWMYAEILKKNE